MRRETERQCMGRRLTGPNYCVQSKLQGYILQYREYSQYYIVTISGKSIKIVNHHIVYLKLVFDINYTSVKKCIWVTAFRGKAKALKIFLTSPAPSSMFLVFWERTRLLLTPQGVCTAPVSSLPASLSATPLAWNLSEPQWKDSRSPLECTLPSSREGAWAWLEMNVLSGKSDCVSLTGPGWPTHASCETKADAHMSLLPELWHFNSLWWARHFKEGDSDTIISSLAGGRAHKRERWLS